jgi:uncharacterized protein
MSDKINIEAVYALPDEQILFSQEVPAGVTVAVALRLSGILDKYPEIDLSRNKVGIFGKMTTLDTVLRARDRIEIYRPLQADPKQVRKRRALKGSGTASC